MNYIFLFVALVYFTLFISFDVGYDLLSREMNWLYLFTLLWGSQLRKHYKGTVKTSNVLYYMFNANIKNLQLFWIYDNLLFVKYF